MRGNGHGHGFGIGYGNGYGIGYGNGYGYGELALSCRASRVEIANASSTSAAGR